MKKRILPLFVMLLAWSPVFSQNEAAFSHIKPGMKNETLEREAVMLANKRGQEYQWHETYYKAVILSGQWQPYVDDNGLLKGRKIHMELLAHMPDGRCAMTDFTFKQKLQPDDTFSGNMFYDHVSYLVYVDCE